MNTLSLQMSEINSAISSKFKNFINLDNIDMNKLKDIILIYFLIAIVTFFILWLIRAIGLYTMAKKNNDKFAFIAFIPFFCFYTQGKLLKKITIFGIEVDKPEFLLPFILISMLIPFAKPLSILLFIISYYAILYKIYKMQVPKIANVLLIFSIFIPFLQPFFIFFIRNEKRETI